MDQIGTPAEPTAYDRLPDYVKQEWAEQEHLDGLRSRDLERRRTATRTRYLLEGMVIFTVFSAFGGPLGMLLGAMFGTAVGFFAWRMGGGTFTFAWVGFAGYLAFWVFTGLGTVFGAIACVSLCALVGFVHSMQKFDGSEC